jgi:hypothetical protein
MNFKCQHKLGHQYWAPYWADLGEIKLCGKPATYIAEYPGKKPSYFCRKHAKTRKFVKAIVASEKLVDISLQ